MVQFLWIGNLHTFHGSIFMDMHNHAITCIYKYACFARQSSTKTVKMDSLKIPNCMAVLLIMH